ncbi:T9SS type A sorting domain-containing protein [Dysgonomonas sp. HDW5B]|uniref:T9SS type A sorting domain-containing protein n=1 Tax=Dysgonomonas sp. HDW5B TaxID=2714927 RepID=UPI0014082D6B|nr:T9SS type A sorting domain-containing protein [Dysgonomonas sp. HDW5B]QIK56129.1 T9SS type A sorting domain-containing protein [Dysgonomonas sp. HDW5B]
MKKLLLLTLLFAIYITGSGQTTIKLSPKDFCGITNKSNVFAKQTLANGIIIGNYNGSIGRAYFEFDLSGIPSNAKITYAGIRLQPKAGQYTNFGGKVRLERAPDGMTDANTTTWNLIKTVGNSGDYIGTEVEFPNTASIKTLGESFLPAHIQSRIGKKIAFLINHKNEQNQFVYLTGNKLDFYLDISYTTQSILPPNPGESGTLKGPKTMYVGDIVTYSVIADKDFDKTVWSYNTTIFELDRRIQYQFEDNLQLKVKKATSATIISVKVTSKDPNYSSMNKNEEMEVVVKPIPDFTIKPVVTGFIVSNNSEITYKIEGIVPEGAKITWTAISNLTYISGQSTTTVKFKTPSYGCAKIKVDIEYVGKKYTQENADVWVGAPPKFTLSSWPFPCGSAGAIKINDLALGYSEKALAESSVSWKVSGVDAFIASQSKTTCSAFCRWSNCIVINFSMTNKYGTTSADTYYPVTTGTCKQPDPGGPITQPGRERSALAPIDQTEIKSVKIYNLSGVLVYSDNAVNGSFDIKSTILTDGVYIIEKFDGENRTSEKIMLKR